LFSSLSKSENEFVQRISFEKHEVSEMQSGELILRQDLWDSIGYDCAERIFKMYLEMRISCLRVEIRIDHLSQIVCHPFFNSPVEHMNHMLSCFKAIRGREEKEAFVIVIYRYIINEFTSRYAGHSGDIMYSKFMSQADVLISQGMDQDTMDFFKATIPKTWASQFL
jgi:hypothetical protein